MPPQISGKAYFQVMAFALLRLFSSLALAALGWMFLVGGVCGIASAGHPDDLACAGVVWGPILIVLAIRWSLRAVEILMAGRTFNRHY
jgi:hypothetical protein